jgi:hypothetical protein
VVAVGATCRLSVREQYMPPQAVAAGATCRLEEFVATTQVVCFVNFIQRCSFLTIHSWGGPVYQKFGMVMWRTCDPRGGLLYFIEKNLVEWSARKHAIVPWSSYRV